MAMLISIAIFLGGAMNHSNAHHEQMEISQHSIDVVQNTNYVGMHHDSTITSFWTLSNSVEVALIVLFIIFFIKNSTWKSHKFTLSLTAIIFFVSMHPMVDSLARHSIWLHCLQSSLVHHLVPLALLFSITITNNKNAQPKVYTTGLIIFSIITFNLMSLMWVLPSLHMQLMENGLLYSAMKWAMALTGILLCKAMLSFNHSSQIAGLNYKQFSILMLAPQMLIGLTLMLLPPLYPMPEDMMLHLAQTVPLAQYLPHLSESMDQILGGLLLLIATLIFLVIDLKRRRHDFSLSTPLSMHKEIV